MGIYGDTFKGLLTKPYLARGCELCYPGAKAVIFVTGLCPEDCYYCPISPEKWQHDVVYVNEERVYSIDEILIEVSRMSALGASITGGEPLIVYERVVEIISTLKEGLGEDFHIHLYTSGSQATKSHIIGLWRAGLDEIRFHPVSLRTYELAEFTVRETSMDVGFEIPIAPGLEEWAMRVISEASRIGAKFVNLNELEVSERNSKRLAVRGLTPSRKRPFTIEGALEAALRVLEWAERNSSIPVHFCPVTFKDSIQFKNRMIRLARHDKRWFETLTEAGTVTWSEIECKNESVYVSISDNDLKRLPRDKDCRLVVKEAYPTRSRLVLHEEEAK